MFIESIKFKRERNSEWERGYYIGDTDNSKNSTFLDSNYQPILDSKGKNMLWDYHTDVENWIQFRCEDK